jgi:chemotaxis protein CheD
MEILEDLIVPTPKINLIVGVGDMIVSNQSNADIVTYALGSCVSVVVYDPVVKVGGLLHALLPDSTWNIAKANSNPAMFVDTGLSALFHAVHILGGVKSRLIIKIAGGIECITQNKLFNIGSRNVEATLTQLNLNGVSLTAKAVGGNDIRTLRLELATGNLTLNIAGKDSRPL